MKTILCIIGNSGSGKTFMTTYLESQFGIKMIESRTTRRRREPGERGHTFITNDEFNLYKKEDMLAFTQWGNVRYCCLREDVIEDVMAYVIDEYGLKYLIKHFNKEFNIISIRIIADEGERLKRINEERLSRDKGKFRMKQYQFDHVLINDYVNFEHEIDKLILKICQ